MLKKLKNVSLKFPAKPMVSFNKSRVKALIKDENIGKPTVELLHDFWEYCVEDSICEGDNPVVEVKKKKRTNRSKQLANSPEIPLKKSALVQEATRTLKTIAISNTVFAALRDEDRSLAAATTLLGHTYERILRTRCNLDDDEGTVRFLLGRSFGTDTTSNNYTSFTSDYGERRLYELLKCVRKEEGHRELLRTDKNNPGLFVCQPATNLQYARVTAEVTLAPGESIKMVCRHGVTGTYATKAIKLSK